MKNKLIYRYLLFTVGLFFNAFGIAFFTKSTLGTTPISSLPYTLSLIFPKLTLGNFTIIISMLLILLQIIILRKKAKIMDILLQIPVSFLFGYIIDFAMWVLVRLLPGNYFAKLVSMLIGCVIISFGAYFEVIADVTMLPADGFTRAITKVSQKEFGNVKLITDMSQAVLAMILGLIFLHRLAGVREGTLIGAVLIGNIVKVIGRFWHLERKFKNDGLSVQNEDYLC